MATVKSRSQGRLEAGAFLLVAALTLLVFWACVRDGFVNSDDPQFVIRPFRGLSLADIRGIFTSFYFSNYVPLSLLTFSVDFALWGMNPAGYHLTNALLHAANAGLFYLLCRELLSFGGETRDDRWAAAGAALFWALHPLRVQSVAWIAERRDVLCGFFFLLSLLFWLRSLRPGKLRGARGKAWSFGMFLLSLLSKAAAIPLVLVLVLLDVWPLRRPLRSLKTWTEKLPFAALAALFAVLAAAAQGKGGGLVVAGKVEPLQKLNQIGIGLVFYLGKLLWPSKLALYEWHWAPVRSAVLLGFAATCVLAVLAWRSRALRAPLLAAWLYQAIMLAPVLGIVTIGHELVADRYSYLSSLGWAVLFGAGLRGLGRYSRAAAAAVAAVILAFLAVATSVQIPVWRDSVSFWKQVARVDPASLAARPSMAAALLAQGRTGEAILELEEHVALNPRDEEMHKALADLLARTGTTEKDHALIHEQLGLEFAAKGEYDKAAWHFERGLRYDPGSDRLKAELERARLGKGP
ncbi:MAG TPA: BTAD domain-containing putative transcriptional regulator [Elusimicrobiota bacterium]|nr:BTAD domain-containing putative transcriptional regulator [Elusimicrobiota bacterium]